jgi:hypothetical protein
MARLLVISLLLMALIGAAFAPAAEAPTRKEYVTRLEAICKPDALATQRAMKGARGDIRAERLKVAARKFARAESIFSGTVNQISTMPRPPGDLTRLRRWFSFLKQQDSFLEQIVDQLRQDHPIKAQRLTSRFIHVGNLANSAVLPMGFNYCSFKFSRYG